MKTLVAPSILAANFLRLEDDIEMVNQSLADFFHLDIMDGKFVPNITFGFDIIKQIKSVAKKPLDIHLMIEDPDRYIDDFIISGADYLSVHYETCRHLHRTIYSIKNKGAKAGVVINPHSPVELLADVANDADFFLIMSVNPGFGGQKFINNTIDRISKLKDIIVRKNSKALIEVDGGVDLDNAKTLVDAGANILVAGSTIFKSDNPAKTIASMKSI